MSFMSPLDLLAVPDVEQDIIRCLIRRPKLTGPEIAAMVNVPLEKLDQILQKMVGESRLAKQTQDGQTCFSVHFEQREKVQKKRPADTRRGAASLLDSLFS